MKKLLLISLLAFPMFLFSQEYSEVIQVEGRSANELYSSAKEWMAIVFNSANEVIQLDDPNNNKLIAKGIKKIDFQVNDISTYISMYFSLIVECKEDRYRYQIYPTTFLSQGGEEYSYELLEKVTTEDGLLDFYKSKGIKPAIIGKKAVAKNLQSNQEIFNKINNTLKIIPLDMQKSITESIDEENW